MRQSGVAFAFMALAWILVGFPVAARPSARLAVTVLIDPGHGGVDPGALAPAGLEEKFVTLRIALAAARRLSELGLGTYLTRTGDRAVAEGPWNVTTDLITRGHLARDVGARLFVSIHADSEPTGQARGPRVYYLRGSAPSLRLAQCIETALNTLTGLYQPPRDAGYLVLRTAGRPAVLIETGFLSHPLEGKALANPAWRASLGEAIALGIARYVDGSRTSVATGSPP